MAARSAEVAQTVEGVSVESVVQRISGLGRAISKSPPSAASLVEEIERLATIRQAVAAERTELERLHNIDVAASALDQMIHDCAVEKPRLEAEIAGPRAAWEEESRTRRRSVSRSRNWPPYASKWPSFQFGCGPRPTKLLPRPLFRPEAPAA